MKRNKNRLAKELWQNVTPHPANGGLWNGEPPDFARTKAIHHRLLADGKTDEANALRAVVTHNVWYAQRATKDTEQWSCARCGAADETLLHRLWTCKNNEQCTHPDVIGSQDLVREAIHGCPDQSAFWLGGLLTGDMLPAKPPPVNSSECNARCQGRQLCQTLQSHRQMWSGRLWGEALLQQSPPPHGRGRSRHPAPRRIGK